MAKLKKIENRTNWFVDAYKSLEKANRLPSNKDLAAIMGMPSKSTVTNILNKEQNIQPEQWQKFKDHFALQDPVPSSGISEQEQTMKEVLVGLTEGFRAIAETMKSIESKMARADTQAKMDANLLRVLVGVETTVKNQEDAMKEIRALLTQKEPRKTTP